MKKVLRSSWTIGVATTLLGFLLTVGYDLLKGKHIFTTIALFCSTLWSWMISFLNFELKVWWILIALAVLAAVLFLVSKLGGAKEETKPDFTSYQSDKFRLWRWSWDWTFDTYEHKWHVKDLKAHCPQCDTPMISDRYEDVFQCPRCRFRAGYDNHEKSYEVEAVIIDNLDRKKSKGGVQN